MSHLGATPQIRAPETLASATSLPHTHSDWPTTEWWTAYGDPALSGLIDEGMKDSPDVAAATARIRQAEALSQQAGAALLPSATLDGMAGGTKQSYNLGIPPHSFRKAFRTPDV
ncbi:hypothetical protein [Sphingomonas paeninsulae]|uniref:hypothetical protein n=1 Tax=Sphingomonas paeninsulae TaxID=2319844 RepID=UPI00324255B1